VIAADRQRIRQAIDAHKRARIQQGRYRSNSPEAIQKREWRQKTRRDNN